MGNKKQTYRIIVSGGGTGGHVFPAISIANAFKAENPDAEILFVGAQGKLEMEKVPEAGYPIVGLPISGMDRTKLSFKNFVLIFRLLKSFWIAFRTIRNFRPNAVVGVGGYASGPTLFMASLMRIPTIIQEQNSYAGVTNKILAKKAVRICVAYDKMDRYFPESKIVKTGNPVRDNIVNTNITKTEAKDFFELDKTKPTVLILGGSLGARTINEAIAEKINIVEKTDASFLWQTGKLYIEKMSPIALKMANVKASAFIREMDKAYAAADIIVSRAGAGTISELCLVGKPVILVPSPNVAEDHQTKNALALSESKAAFLVPDSLAVEKLAQEIESLLKNKEKQALLSANISKLAINDSAKQIAEHIKNIINEFKR